MSKEYTLDVAEAKMTLFYSKRTGVIWNFCGGEQGFETFEEEKREDFKMILDKLIVPFDEDVISNTSLYKIENGEIVLKSMPVFKYSIARNK